MERRSQRRRSAERAQGSAWHWFKHDLADARERYVKRTSAAHKRVVLLLLLIGAALRLWLMLEPVTASEATAYMAFAVQPFSEAVSDYSLPVNHILHTVLTKWSTALLGVNVVGLRMPAFLAGLAALPLFYLFARSLFNRYIALMALAMAAGFPPLAELSAIAHGYSLTWCAMLAALLLGRHLVRENNPWSALFMGVALALGTWAVPSMVFPALMVLLWTLFSIMAKYERSLNQRLAMLGLSTAAFLAASLLLYLPVAVAHGVDQLFHHVTEGDASWKAFAAGYADKVLELWVWVVDPASTGVALLGFAGILHATYISAKYRAILFALVLGALPLTLLLRDAGDPWQWAYMLFFLHLGSAIALFYLLKLVQDRVFQGFGKRTRTGWASIALVAVFASGMGVARDRVAHLHEAPAAAEFLAGALGPADRLCVDTAWEAAISFSLQRYRIEAVGRRGDPPPGARLFVVVGAPTGPGPDEAISRCGQSIHGFDVPEMLKDWPRMEIFAARKR